MPDSGLSRSCKVEIPTFSRHKAFLMVSTACLPALRGCWISNHKSPPFSGRPIPLLAVTSLCLTWFRWMSSIDYISLHYSCARRRPPRDLRGLFKAVVLRVNFFPVDLGPHRSAVTFALQVIDPLIMEHKCFVTSLAVSCKFGLLSR